MKPHPLLPRFEPGRRNANASNRPRAWPTSRGPWRAARRRQADSCAVQPHANPCQKPPISTSVRRMKTACRCGTPSPLATIQTGRFAALPPLPVCQNSSGAACSRLPEFQPTEPIDEAVVAHVPIPHKLLHRHTPRQTVVAGEVRLC